MSNTNSPFGFRWVDRIDGAPANAGLVSGLSLGSAAMFYGDVLSFSAGYVAAAAVVGGGATIAGVAQSFAWISKAQGRQVWAQYYPGSDVNAGAYVTVKLIADPLALFLAQCVTGPITQANVGQYANFAVGGGGNTASGISSYELNDGTLTGTKGNLPFQVVRLIQPPNSDPTSAYNQVVVQMVNLLQGI